MTTHRDLKSRQNAGALSVEVKGIFGAFGGAVVRPDESKGPHEEYGWWPCYACHLLVYCESAGGYLGGPTFQCTGPRARQICREALDEASKGGVDRLSCLPTQHARSRGRAGRRKEVGGSKGQMREGGRGDGDCLPRDGQPISSMTYFVTRRG